MGTHGPWGARRPSRKGTTRIKDNEGQRLSVRTTDYTHTVRPTLRPHNNHMYKRRRENDGEEQTHKEGGGRGAMLHINKPWHVGWGDGVKYKAESSHVSLRLFRVITEVRALTTWELTLIAFLTVCQMFLSLTVYQTCPGSHRYHNCWIIYIYLTLLPAYTEKRNE